jgi:hypothetical protein
MEDNTLVQSSFSATINAPIEKVDIPSWCFTLPESEYQACSPAHYAAGSTTAPDGRRMSINVEVLGGSMIVHRSSRSPGWPASGRECIWRLPNRHRLVHFASIEIRADRAYDIVDEGMYLLVWRRPIEVAGFIRDIAV